MQFLTPAAVFAAFSILSFGQTAPDPLVDGRALLKQLKGDPVADAPVFQQVGVDRAQQLLAAVMSHGMATTATLDEWAELHRSLDALVALWIFRGEPMKAASYAFFNDVFYRQHEQNYQAALASATQSLELQIKAGQPPFLQYKAIGDDLRALGRLSEALDAYAKSQKSQPDPTASYAAALERDMVQVMLAAGDQEGAVRESSRMSQTALSAPPIFQAHSKLAESDVLFAEGTYPAGLEAIKRALALIGSDPQAATFSWEAAASVATAVIDGLYSLSYDEALALARLADQQIPGLPIQVVPFAQDSIRRRRRLAGELDAVLREDIDRVTTARQSGNIRALIEALRTLSGSYAFVNGTRERTLVLEEAVDAEKRLLPADGIPDNAGSQSSYFSTANALGYAYLSAGQPAPAGRVFDTVLKIYGSYRDAAVQARLRGYQENAVIGKAEAMALADRPDDARAVLQETLKTISKKNRSQLLLEIGRLERTLNEKPVAAVEAYEKAIAGLHDERDYAEEIGARLALARYLETKALNRVPDARQKAEENLAAVESIAASLQYAEAAWRVDFLRGVLAETGQPQVAIQRYREAIAKLDRIRAGLSQQEQRQAFLDNESIEELYSRLVALLGKAGLHEEAWQYLERAKARSFLEMLQGRRFAVTSAPPAVAELNQLEKKMGELRFELSPESAVALRGAGRQPDALKLELRNLEARFALAREQAGLEQSRSGHVLALQPPPLSRIQKELPPRTALIEYGLLNGEVTAFIITREHVDQVSWKMDTDHLRQDVLDLKLSLANHSSMDWPPLLDAVSKSLIAPVAGRIPKDTRQLTIVPAGYLNYLPFPALLLPNGRALLEAYSISYLPSASALLYLGADKPGTGGDLFLGAFGKSAVEKFPPLPGTLAETAGIAALYPHAKLVSGAAFTHDEARRALTDFDIVHFATHSDYDEGTPMFSALLTSPAAGQSSRLSAYELVGLPLRARLVVLSACETDRGKLLNGDELIGLTRTFLTAGADTVVSSLWQVSDESTALLMQEFYRRLRKGLSPAESLRESALAVRAKYKHPFYWAPFIVTGRN